jgi:hypothetical protein
VTRLLAVAAALAAGLAALAAAGLATAPLAGAQDRPRWDTRLLAVVPLPGYPALAYVHPNGRIYVGTYVNPRGDSQPSRVFEYTTRGVLVRSWTVAGQDLSAEHGVQVATSDARGRLVLLDRSPGASASTRPSPTWPPALPGAVRTALRPSRT